MKNLFIIILLMIQTVALSTEPLPKQVEDLVNSINMYLDRTEQTLDSDYKTKMTLAKRQFENVQETIDELFSERYKNKFDHQHPEILKYQKRLKKIESILKQNKSN